MSDGQSDGTLGGREVVFAFLMIVLGILVFEGRPPFSPEQFAPDSSAESISFVTTNNLRLQGSLFRNTRGPARALILFCHEFGSNRWSAQYYCKGLLQAGFDVFAFDFRNQGDSDELPGYRPLHWLTQYEVQDVRAALACIKDRPDLKDLPLGLLGISRGGVAGLIAAADEPSIKCVVSDGAYSAFSMLQHYIRRWGGVLYLPDSVLRRIPQWHISLTIHLVMKVSQIRQGCRYVDLERALARITQPVLMISGERDTYVIPELTHKLHLLTRQKIDSVWIVPGAKHNKARSVATAAYDNRLQRFFSLLGPSQTTPTVSASVSSLIPAPAFASIPGVVRAARSADPSRIAATTPAQPD